MNDSTPLQRLKDGNARYTSGHTIHTPTSHKQRRTEVVAGQKPFAVVLGCADSRVPVELLFDQSLGDLFVVRSAGNLVDDLLLASIEFAVQNFGVGLIVVMGHSQCGAIDATIDAVENQSVDSDANIILKKIRPVISRLIIEGVEDLAAAAVRQNAINSAALILEQSETLQTSIKQGSLQIVSAQYDLESGVVEFITE